MARFIISGTRRNLTDSGLFLCGATVYISNSGCATYAEGKAHRYKSEKEAERDIGYFREAMPLYSWVIEQVRRKAVSK